MQFAVQHTDLRAQGIVTGLTVTGNTKSHGLWTLPNAVSYLRIVVAAPVILLIVQKDPTALWFAVAIMIFAEFTDFLDGYLARRTGQVSNVGKILDPMADSLYRIAVFTAFVANHWMPLWMVLIVLGRDVGVSYLRVIAEQKIGTMGARQSGKWKAVAQGAAQFSVVIAYAHYGSVLPSEVDWMAYSILALATAVTAYSFADYSFAVYKGIKKL